MSEGKKEKKREIKQVYLSEDGNEENAVSSGTAEKADPVPKKPEKENHAHSHQNHVVRKIAIAVTMVFSLLLAMTVGIGLALWDSNRTMSDLRTAMFTKEVMAAQEEATEEDKDDPAADEDMAGRYAEVSDAVEAGEDEIDDVPSDEDEYGLTFQDPDGIDGVVKAGGEDEIALPEEDDDPDVVTDPTADYPLPFTTVDESYFTDALFIGDSRLQGFGFWSGLPATYYCATGFHVYKYETAKVVQTENGKVPIFDAMPYDAFTKIYIKVGLNELGYGTEKNFEETYAQLIAKLREAEPRAIIYVHAILPVTAEKSATDSAHNNPDIVQRNEALKKFAASQKAYFLDAGPVLSDDAGNLKPEMTSDGIHLKPEYMKIWREYLCEHAVVIGNVTSAEEAETVDGETVKATEDTKTKEEE